MVEHGLAWRLTAYGHHIFQHFTNRMTYAFLSGSVRILDNLARFARLSFVFFIEMIKLNTIQCLFRLPHFFVHFSLLFISPAGVQGISSSQTTPKTSTHHCITLLP